MAKVMQAVAMTLYNAYKSKLYVDVNSCASMTSQVTILPTGEVNLCISSGMTTVSV